MRRRPRGAAALRAPRPPGTSALPAAYRRRLQIGLALFAAGLVLPALIWLSFPGAAPAPAGGAAAPTGTPRIVRVGRGLDEPIPADWEPPNLNPALEAAALEIPDTLPLSETAGLSATLPITDHVFAVALPAQVASKALNLRDGPGGNYLALQVLRETTPLTAVGRYEGWYEVLTPAGVIGWVDDRFVAIGGDGAALPEVAAIPDPDPQLLGSLDADGAHLRSEPSRSSESLAVLKPGDGALTLISRREDWYRIRTTFGNEGWVSADLVAASDYVARRVPTLAASPQALAAVKLARKYIGSEYVWGGETPRQGFDCSGLVMYVYGKLGLELPHSAAEQWSGRYAQKVTRQRDLRPGDIVFFKNTYKRGVSHVGIYAGDRLVIQAISENVGISVSSMDEDYWADRYVGAIRPFP